MSFTKKILTAVVSLLILGAIPLTTLILRGNLDYRSSAKNNGAVLTLDPNTGTIKTGGDFEVSILLNTTGKSITGADVVLSFDQNNVAVVDSDPGKEGTQVKNGSLFDNPLILTNKVADGKVYLSASSFTPFKGAGVFGTVKFQALRSGNVKLAFVNTETKIAQQGTGQNIIVQANDAAFTVENSGDNSSPTSTSAAETTPAATAVPTDLNNDGKTDDLDMQLFAKKWGAKDLSTDLNKDGKVDQTDLQLFIQSFKTNTAVKP